MNKKKIINAIVIASGRALGVKGIRDVTFQSDVNLSTRSMFGERNQMQMIFAQNGQAYQDKIRSRGTIKTVTAVCRFMMDSNSSEQTSYVNVSDSSNPSQF